MNYQLLSETIELLRNYEMLSLGYWKLWDRIAEITVNYEIELLNFLQPRSGIVKLLWFTKLNAPVKLRWKKNVLKNIWWRN